MKVSSTTFLFPEPPHLLRALVQEALFWSILVSRLGKYLAYSKKMPLSGSNSHLFLQKMNCCLSHLTFLASSFDINIQNFTCSLYWITWKKILSLSEDFDIDFPFSLPNIQVDLSHVKTNKVGNDFLFLSLGRQLHIYNF